MITLVSENIWNFDLEAALKEISEQRREQALKFRHEQGQRLCVLAYQLLKQGLREAYGITDNPVFEYNEHGKPSIVGHPEIFFNLSHCKEAAACVISDRPVGIDVESIQRYKESLVRYTMNDEEVRRIESSSDPASAFIRFWTMKEAVTKLIGTGISNDMKTVLNRTDLQFETHECLEKGYIYSVCQFCEDFV